jgi:hypothetical protein
MRAFVPACTLALALSATAYAQDSTVKSKTKVKVDDARAVVMTGCLTQAGAAYMLSGVVTAAGEDLTIRSRVKTDVDDDDVTVKTRTEAEIDDDDDVVGTSGIASMYLLEPRSGVNLATHVGHRVEIAGVMLAPARGDDDAEVTIREDTRIKRDDAPDARVKSRTETELPRGAHARLSVVSVKPLSGACPAN